ncbi:hypothetical protein [Marinobacter sp. ELB17]|uniref:hypothetical protein n=1 Tax=Marinobacter sp. ELB17 TaxID=270374 RepID=UPI0000F39B7C|nr:hypothetical protein [Marinobacter sp. ELB17]EAZ99686.1 hypothetical protein MELB17_11801 [Marinobacter sp. ELB17]
MKKIIIATAITALFSMTANANSGLADRINEARSYPNKTVETVSPKMLHLQHKRIHMKMDKAEYKNHSNSSGSNHAGQMRAQDSRHQTPEIVTNVSSHASLSMAGSCLMPARTLGEST